MQTNSNTVPMKTTPNTTRVGHCLCGVPVAEHFDDDNRSIECGPARGRWERRLRAEASQIDLIQGTLAIVLLARRGGQATTGSAFENLSDADQRAVRCAAVGAFNMLDADQRKAARERGVLEGLKSIARISGRALLNYKLERDYRDVFADVMNGHDCAIQGITPITAAELARLQGVDYVNAPASAPRTVESAQPSEGRVQ